MTGRRVALWAGGADGLGRSIVLGLARRGMDLVLSSPSGQEMGSLKEDAQALGAHSFAAPADVTQPASVREAVRAALQALGRVDALVYQTRKEHPAPVSTPGPETMRRAMTANFYGAVHFTQALLPGFLSRGQGRFVFVTSALSRRPRAGHSAACASAAALEAFAESLRRELRGTAVTSSVVCAAESAPPPAVARAVAGAAGDGKRWRTVPARAGLSVRLGPGTGRAPRPAAGGLEDRVAILVGATGGVGQVIARALVQERMKVVLTARSAKALDELRSQLDGERALAVPADANGPSGAEEVVEAAVRTYGRVDAVVYAAGMGLLMPVAETSFEDFQQIFAVNFDGAVHYARAVLPHFERQGSGAIVNVSAVGGEKAFEYLSAYCAAKAAMGAFTRSLRQEAREKGVRVSLVIPGVMNTPFMAHLLHRERTDMALCPREQKSLAPMVPDRAAAVVVDALRTGRPQRVFPWTLNLYLRINRALSPEVADRFARVYMDFKGVKSVTDTLFDASDSARR